MRLLMRTVLTLAVIACLFVLQVPAYAAAGDLDQTFGAGGVVHRPTGELGTGVTLQPDGKILVVGTVINSMKWAIARYRRNGALDGSFGSGGVATVDFGTTECCAYATDVLLQPDGRIVLVGAAVGLSLVRLNPDGTLDTSFGSGGIVESELGLTSVQHATLQPDGDIVVVGQSYYFSYEGVVARYLPDGSLDSSFGSGGVVINRDDAFVGVAVETDGSIVAVGSTGSRSSLEMMAVRYLPGGSPDASFGSDGEVAVPFGANPSAGNAVALQGDGKIVIAGFAGANRDFVLARLDQDGSLDTSFSKDGTTSRLSFDGCWDQTDAVAVQADGKIVAVGGVPCDPGQVFGLARWTASGKPDSTFGAGGKVTTAIHTSAFSYGVALQTDGKIVVAGASQGALGSPWSFTVARYLAS